MNDLSSRSRPKSVNLANGDDEYSSGPEGRPSPGLKSTSEVPRLSSVPPLDSRRSSVNESEASEHPNTDDARPRGAANGSNQGPTKTPLYNVSPPPVLKHQQAYRGESAKFNPNFSCEFMDPDMPDEDHSVNVAECVG
jgi:hypothetical protein